MKCRTFEALWLLCAFVFSVHAQTPVILSQPQSITINNASTATFSIVASNAATYQWKFSGTNIAEATNSTYTCDNVTTNQEGFYSVEVTSSGGENTNSQPAQLTILQGTLLQITFSGFPNGSPSNVVVQLFDHDKPATVANFLHYITPAIQPGALTNLLFSNMIWSRCVPGFVLQGGSYDTQNRTNTTPLLQPLTQINPISTIAQPYAPPFPLSIDSEFRVGPRIPNTFGTMAMALQSGNPDSASSGFFFNLTNNSSQLDIENGGFTVFGRVLSGSNVLQYFNTLSKPNEGIFDQSTLSTNATFTDLPVNFHGWQAPALSNLFYADLQLLTSNAPDTNAPIVVMTSPTNGQTMTNADVVFQGTASDNVAVARVICTFIAADGSGLGTINAAGTTNWTGDFGPAYGNLPPGAYTYHISAQDGAGNLSTNGTGPSEELYGTFVVPSFLLPPTNNGNGSLSPTLTNATIGNTYTITATPGKGAVFVNWSFGSFNYLFQTATFTLQNGVQPTANFISNTMPANEFFITFPAANEQLTNATINFGGTVAKSVGSAQIACQVFSASSGISASSNMVINAANTWATPPLSLAPGVYTVQAIATASNGLTRLISQNFTVLAPLTIIQYGPGRVSIPSGTYETVGHAYLIRATPAGGGSFLSWNSGNGTEAYPAISFAMSAGLTLTATFVSNSLPDKLTFVSPAPYSVVATTNVTLSGKIASTVSGPQVVCQLIENYTPFTAFTPATVVGGTNWTVTLTNIPMGTYSAVAILTDASGKTTVASDKFSVNIYPNLAGSYHGLFLDTNSISETNAGSLSFTLTGTGSVYGSLTFPVANFLFYQQYGSATGKYDLQIPAFKGTLSLAMDFDITNYSGKMTGFLTNGGQACPLTAYRAVTKLSTNTIPSTGIYALNLAPVSPTNGNPTGDGFAAVKVSANGSLAVGGTLADNTPFSLSTGVASNGVWPLYAKLNNGKGILIGWETNSPTNCTGTLFWLNSTNHGGYYPDGVSEELDSFGAKFVPPVPGADYQIIFGGGSLSNMVTNQFSFKASGSSYMIVPAPGTTDQLTGTLLSTGVFSKADIINPFNDKKLPFTGSFISPSEGGGGFTQDINAQTGFFIIPGL